MRYYKIADDGYILGVGVGNGGTEITDNEYNQTLAVIRNKPEPTPTTDYRLRDDMTWEEYEIEPPEPSEDIDDSEALEIILGGAE